MSMQLCLVNNNPISTVLITPDGDPLFAIETPPAPYNAITTHVPTLALPKPPTSRTTIKRLEPYHMSSGHAETEIAVIEYRGTDKGCQLQLSADNHTLDIPPHRTNAPRRIEERLAPETEETEEEEEYRENSWEFTSSDSERYVWKMFAHTPVLISSADSLMPVARYRRAKIGIISRSRRAFLEIFPAGLAIIDLIVVTFVAFMKQRILIDNIEHTSSNATPRSDYPPSTAPSTLSSRTTPEVPQLSVFEPRHMYSFPPR